MNKLKEYFLRTYSEIHYELVALRRKIAEHHVNAQHVKPNARYEARQVHLLLQTFIESRKVWPRLARGMLTKFKERVEQYTDKDDASHNYFIRKIVKTLGCVDGYIPFWAMKITEQARLIRWVSSNMGGNFHRHFSRSNGFEGLAIKSDPEGKELHVYFGGDDGPLGPGHGHYQYDLKSGKLVFKRDPK